MEKGDIFEFKGIIGVENKKLAQGLFMNADTNEPLVFCLPKKEAKKIKDSNTDTNKEKAIMIAEQCRPCTDDFYSGIYQGVIIALTYCPNLD